jgi:hypothetical protein
VGFSATRRIGIEEAEAKLSAWLAEMSHGAHDASG